MIHQNPSANQPKEDRTRLVVDGIEYVLAVEIFTSADGRVSLRSKLLSKAPLFLLQILHTAMGIPIARCQKDETPRIIKANPGIFSNFGNKLKGFLNSKNRG